MWNIRSIIIDQFVEQLRSAYQQTYNMLEPQYVNVIEWTGRLALENISNTDSLYHNVDHTIMVTLVGQSILKGKHLLEGGVTPKAWMHFTMALLFHDIGYVRGVCQRDKPGEYATGKDNQTVKISSDYTDAALAPYHVDRSKLFVKERFSKNLLVDFLNVEAINEAIEMTRFPIPDDPSYQATVSMPALARAADFIGQIGDPDFLRKQPALYYEFQESDTPMKDEYLNPGHLRHNFTEFYWGVVVPYIPEALRYLQVTQIGRQWIANLYAHVYKVEHDHI